MTSALDAAAYIIQLSTNIGEPITNMKLQKLLYYSYAWYLVETKGNKLFDDQISAWEYGPVVRSVYNEYRDYQADTIKEVKNGDISNLDSVAKGIIEDVFNVYGDKSAIELMQLTHSEAPWRDAYDEENNKVIDDKSIFSFYSAKKQQAEQVTEVA